MSYGPPMGAYTYGGMAAGGIRYGGTAARPARLAREDDAKNPSKTPHFLEMWAAGGKYTLDYSSTTASSASTGYHLWNLYDNIHNDESSNVLYVDGHAASQHESWWDQVGPSFPTSAFPYMYHFSFDHVKP